MKIKPCWNAPQRPHRGKDVSVKYEVELEKQKQQPPISILNKVKHTCNFSNFVVTKQETMIWFCPLLLLQTPQHNLRNIYLIYCDEQFENIALKPCLLLRSCINDAHEHESVRTYLFSIAVNTVAHWCIFNSFWRQKIVLSWHKWASILAVYCMTYVINTCSCIFFKSLFAHSF